MYDEQARQTGQRTNNLRDELIWGRTPSADKGWCISAPIQPYSSYRYLNKKRKCCNHRYPDSDYFYTMLLFIYLPAIGRLICRREMSLLGSTAFGFVQNTIHDFQNIVFNS